MARQPLTVADGFDHMDRIAGRHLGWRHGLFLILNFAFLILLGCKSAPPPAPVPTAPMPAAISRSTAEVVTAPQMTLVWNPGGYSNFVLVSTGDLRTPLAQWTAFLSTDQTNAIVPMDQPAQFFALYGTNNGGQSAWATQ